jgi:hypothetical protein
MAEFNWVAAPPYGTCLSCGSSQNDRGFVDTFAEVNIRRDGHEITGVADAVFCAQCIEQMGQRVGMASKTQVDEFAYRELEKDQEAEKLADEVKAWQERFDALSELLPKGVSLVVAEETEDAPVASES